MSELSSSVREGVGYNKVFLSGCEPGEDFSRSPEREPSTQSLSDENKEEVKGDVKGDEEDGEDDEDDKDDEGTQFEGGDLGGSEDGGAHPFSSCDMDSQ